MVVGEGGISRSISIKRMVGADWPFSKGVQTLRNSLKIEEIGGNRVKSTKGNVVGWVVVNKPFPQKLFLPLDGWMKGGGLNQIRRLVIGRVGPKKVSTTQNHMWVLHKLYLSVNFFPPTTDRRSWDQGEECMYIFFKTEGRWSCKQLWMQIFFVEDDERMEIKN